MVVPFHHTVSHNLKPASQEHGIRLLFSNGFQLDWLTPFSKTWSPCNINHRALDFIPWAKNTVYLLPLACRFVYNGQTSQCISQRLGLHRNKPYDNLAGHLKLCNNFRLLWGEISILVYKLVLCKCHLCEAAAI